ncbi:MAG: CHAD domain-containing protein, partial [Hyphomicrobiaceae bacterium]|nr:CHAD domain-containing protein [Hyphomicrobiaceae bacterium]
MSYKLKLAEPLERSVKRVGLAQIDAAIVRLRAERDPEHVVHMARKGFKKLRALLRLVRPGLDDGVFDHENARFRDLARELSAMRDRHVLAETVHAMAAISDGASKTAFAVLAKRLNAVPSSGEAPAAANSDSLLEAIAAHLEWARSAFEEISVAGGYDTAFTGIADSYRKARRAMHHGFTTLDAEDLHEFRKHTQHHWRHMQLVSAAWPEYFEARAATARRLSTIL